MSKRITMPPNILSIYQNRPIILRFAVICITMVEKKLREQLRDVALNDGLHVGGIALLPPVNRLNGRGLRLDGHFVNDQRLYAGRGSQIRRISADPIIQTPERATDYVLKALKRGRVSFDDIWIFPRSKGEISSDRFVV